MMERIGAVSDGMAEDMLRAITQLICAEGHYKTLIEKYDSQLNNGLIEEDEAAGYVDCITESIAELRAVSEERRALMLRLMRMYPNADKTMWCSVKHLLNAEYCAFEVYQATENDAAALSAWLCIRRRTVKAITLWLGVEVTECSSCLSDILKGNEGIENVEYEADNSM